MNFKKAFCLWTAALAFAAACAQGDICYSVRRIWGDGSRHYAFTSLLKYKGSYYCAFREGFDHIFNATGEADGTVRIIRSGDGANWTEAAAFKMEGYDLRDPKLSIAPDGRMMLQFGRAEYRDRKFVSSTTFVAFSADGSKFSKPMEVRADASAAGTDSWLWRVTWNGATGYGVNKCGEQEKIELWTTADGVSYRVAKTFDIAGFPNEATVRFAPDGRMLVYVRRDKGDRHTLLLSATPPYTEWTQKDLGFFCGGPDAIVLPGGRVLLGGRSTFVPGHPKTTIYAGTTEGDFMEAIVLPSGGDTSYPSFLQVGGEVWISYYSAHEGGKPSIYLAKVPLRYFGLARR